MWRPKDIVGGDIYWAKEVKNGYVVALIDCTGHGVPGALMTMTAISSLGNIVNNSDDIEPGKILNLMKTGGIANLLRIRIRLFCSYVANTDYQKMCETMKHLNKKRKNITPTLLCMT